MGIPDIIVKAARSHRPGRRSETVGRTVQRGDLRVVSPPYAGQGDARIGLVLEGDLEHQIAEIALVHPFPDLATSFDGIVPKELVGGPFDVVVQTDLRGVVWTAPQVGAYVGRLAPQCLEAISELVARSGFQHESGIRLGTRLGGTSDRRWAFKEAEGRALDVLTEDCSSELVQGRSPWRLGRDLLRPEVLGDTANLHGVLEELMHWLDTRDLRIDLETALALEEMGALDESAWESVGLTFEVYEVLLSAVKDSLLGSSPTIDGDWNRSVCGPRGARSEFAADEVVHVLGRRIRSVAA